MKSAKFNVFGMSCAACSQAITKTLSALKGVQKVQVSLLTNSMVVGYNPDIIDIQSIKDAVLSLGYNAEVQEKEKKVQNVVKNDSTSLKWRLFFSIIFLLPLFYLSMGPMLHIPLPPFFRGAENAISLAFTQFLLSIVVAMINSSFFKKGFGAIVKMHATMDSLIAIGSLSSIVYGVYSIYKLTYLGGGNVPQSSINAVLHNLYFESSSTILTLVTLGKYMESIAKKKTTKAIAQLMKLKPDIATVIRDSKEVKIPYEQIKEGDIVCIKAGERLPVDGIVVEGYGLLDESAITGESFLQEKREKDSVVSATMNMQGYFRFSATKVGSETTLAKIIDLVKEASDSSAPIAHLADKVSSIFVPLVLLLSLTSFCIWFFAFKDFAQAFSSAISVLVISCPCALGLATPTAIMVGMGRCARGGILIKSGDALESFHKIKVLALDKTGTITEGRPTVSSITSFSQDIKEEELLSFAYSIEEKSSHPIAFSIIEEAKKRNIKKLQVENFESIAGLGVKGEIAGRLIVIGNQKMLSQEGFSIKDDMCANVKDNVTPLFVAIENKDAILTEKDAKKSVVGLICIQDKILTSARLAISDLKNMGIKPIMLTGDNSVVANTIAKEVGIDDVFATLMPIEKANKIKKLKEGGSLVAMVGDGINDAPSLALADVGIAVGRGQDIAIEAADIILMKRGLYSLVNAVSLSRMVMRVIKQNLFWALFYNGLCIPIAMGALYPFFGIMLSPSIAALAMSFSSVSVVLNALKINRFKEKKIESDTCPLVAKNNNATNEENDASLKGDIKESSMEKAEDNRINGGIDDSIDSIGGENMKSVFFVEDISCNHCASNIQRAISSTSALKGAKVNISVEKRTVTVEHGNNVTADIIMNAIKVAGYHPLQRE